MYYGNKAKVHIPGWWEIRKMCKGVGTAGATS